MSIIVPLKSIIQVHVVKYRSDAVQGTIHETQGMHQLRKTKLRKCQCTQLHPHGQAQPCSAKNQYLAHPNRPLRPSRQCFSLAPLLLWPSSHGRGCQLGS
uniref:Uncharacterized protein n=1 Tax=Spironucleus salmonicida TaxID=348837 RepID=V6LTT7_9EUKA|eukprot:EST48072.1 Hypothetical protein SS50377_11801 [Spironucleus salmonicida]